MNKPNLLHNRFMIAFTFLLIVTLACGPTPAEVVPPTATSAPPQPTATPLPKIPSVSELSAATVQILMFAGGEFMGWGSGTIISSDGLILTNAHVADNHAPGLALLYDPSALAAPEVDELRIALVESPDQPPVETYLAELVISDGILDIALIQIVSNLDGEPVAKTTLNLPFVELGDSDEVQLGDSVRIFGFPGAGGETITFTQGTVSGFESQEPVGDRVWIKTDTEISPGNSGGLAVNEAGQFIGIPSRGNELGRLSSINFAKPLIDAALAGREYDPYINDGTGNEEFTLTTWAMDYDENGCPIDPVEQYPSGSLALIGVWSYQAMSDGEEFLVFYFLNDELIWYEARPWDGGSSGECHASAISHNSGEAMPDGDYQFRVFAGSGLPLVGSAATTVGGEVQSGDINVKGLVYDSLTNAGIADAFFFVLNPGVDIAEWFNNDFPDSDIYTFAVTDSKGNYVLPVSLERLVEYPVVVGAEGYYNFPGIFRFSQTDPVQFTVDVSLEPR